MRGEGGEEGLHLYLKGGRALRETLRVWGGGIPILARGGIKQAGDREKRLAASPPPAPEIGNQHRKH